MARRLPFPTALLLAALLPAQQPSTPDAAPDTAPAATPPATGTQLWLPDATGRVTIDDTWTVLRPADIEAATRPSDPTAEPARTILLTAMDDLRTYGTPSEHLVFQRTTTPGQLVLVNCFFEAAAVKTADLLDESKLKQMEEQLLTRFGKHGATARLVDHARTDWFSTGGLVMRFEQLRDGATWRRDIYAVPAGDHVQHFEVLATTDDPTAQPAIEALLRSFDGAKEGDTLQGMLLGGAAGAFLGIFAARWLGRRRRAAQAAAGPGANAG